MSTDLGRGFEERLLEELRQVVIDRSGSLAAPYPTPARSHRRRWTRRLALVAAGVAAALAVAVATPLTSNGSGSAAYAVSRHDDGTIRVEIYGIHDQAGANALERDLEAAGVPDAEAYYIPTEKVCRGDPSPNVIFTESWVWEFTVDPADLQGLILIVEYYIYEATGEGLVRAQARTAPGPIPLEADNLPPCAIEADSPQP